MKQIPKDKLDGCIEACREYYCVSHKRALVMLMHNRSNVLGKEIGTDMFAVSDFISVIIRNRGISPDAENETIYSALRVLGWEVVE